MSIIENSKIYEKYKIISNIGSGGFAKVFKVQEINDTSNTFYALKYFVSPKNSDEEISKKRFSQEIKVLSKVNSKYVAKFIDAYIGDNEQYIIMEYVDGINLKDKLSEGKLNIKTVQNYALQIADGLEELHASGIIHRDIKSNNIMITSERTVKIIDFGLALDDESQRHTQVTKIVGSLYYLAPELCKTNNKPTIKTDIYALGILIYEMLTGEYPFKGADAMQTIKKQEDSPLPDLVKIADVPQAFANVVIKATAKDPDKRYDSVYSLKTDLKTVLNPERSLEKPLDVKTIKIKKTFVDFINNKLTLYIGLGAIALLIVIIIIIAVLV
ncbi:Serine/threonine protein kinase PrkC [Mycoplasmopsis meleagridis]|uniref:Serine/threonine protein kinase PrkC, regulator of stationary phase n=1 Tax=Mycoplasmopsis meleagridis ATCC 25294 TaxID=1264554 RepID=A0A0F5H0N3_9BACT|nr:serine/threonine-protein kinase [Mycoplasmopsis meleagridis]KKB26685.1 Serine/threonine protein kinase PrkC, regulator of stationary phase [Mycoplasmopsis meleagridis ATCC 25294]KUH47615.1 serine/threonine protein kinase [Mycoplasmopsis meleagridis]OAD18199.1 Serine/threonine protein kinase PrkC [Mycoplasmopsis meleagridis]VEU77740.1 serine/threonine protein kinase [Mycoplasmopsis meleagridis]